MHSQILVKKHDWVLQRKVSDLQTNWLYPRAQELVLKRVLTEFGGVDRVCAADCITVQHYCTTWLHYLETQERHQKGAKVEQGLGRTVVLGCYWYLDTQNWETHATKAKKERDKKICPATDAVKWFRIMWGKSWRHFQLLPSLCFRSKCHETCAET